MSSIFLHVVHTPCNVVSFLGLKYKYKLQNESLNKKQLFQHGTINQRFQHITVLTFWIEIKFVMLWKVQSKNKRSKGHIAHLRNQFKSMKTFQRSYDYIYIIKLTFTVSTWQSQNFRAFRQKSGMFPSSAGESRDVAMGARGSFKDLFPLTIRDW